MAKTKSRQINELVISLSKKAQKVLKNKKSTLKEKQQAQTIEALVTLFIMQQALCDHYFSAFIDQISNQLIKANKDPVKEAKRTLKSNDDFLYNHLKIQLSKKRN